MVDKMQNRNSLTSSDGPLYGRNSNDSTDSRSNLGAGFLDYINNTLGVNEGDGGTGGTTEEVNVDGRRIRTATNLTPTNQGIAQQFNLLDGINAYKQRLREQNAFQRKFFFSDPDVQEEGGEKEDIASDLCRRVNNLSLTERQQAQNDVYGFRLKHNDEDPVELSIWMNEMDDAIQRGISGKDKKYSALRLAIHTTKTVSSGGCGGRENSDRNGTTNANDTTEEAMNVIVDGSSGNNTRMDVINNGAEFVRSQRLKFLRAADWDVEEAVKRLAHFLEIKLEHFGSESLIRDYTLLDLSQTDRELWQRHGFLQISEERDAYGRVILVMVGKQQYHLPKETVTRVLIYMSMILTKDETVQKTGIVLLYLAHGQSGIVDRRATELIEVYKGLPLRGVAVHLCYDNLRIQPFLQVLARLVRTWGAVRMRAHKGTMMECAYNLMTYGIPRNAIPINDDESIELEFHHCFLEALEQKEAGDRLRQQQLDQYIALQNGKIQYDQQQCEIGSQLPERDPYQQEPQTMTIEEKDERSSFLSMNMSGLEPLSLRSGELDVLPDEFVNRLANMGNSNTSITEKDQIAPSMIPVGGNLSSTAASSNEGNERTNNKTTAIPAHIKSYDFIVAPGPLDVIMGRGRHNKKKPGNKKLNQLLESYQEEYEASDKFQKTVLSEVVVSKMAEDGSRFLVREGDKKHGMWVEVTLEKARDKVAHDFRNLRRNAKLKSATPSNGEVGSNGNHDEMRKNNPKRQRSLTNLEHDDSKRSHGM